MTTRADKALIRRLFEEVWNKGDEGVQRELLDLDRYDEDFVVGPTRVSGMPQAFLLELHSYRSFFPDLRFTLVEMAAEGGLVIARWVARGTHTGTSRLGLGVTNGEDIAPTGKEMTAEGMSISRIENRRIREHRQYGSPLSLLQVMAIRSGALSPATLLEHWGYRPEEDVFPQELHPVM